MHSLWRVALALLVGFIAVVGLVGTVQTFVEQSALRESSVKKDDTIEGLSADVRETRRRLDKLADQNAGLVELLRKQGVVVPSALLPRTTSVRTIEHDSSDNDDSDGDTVIVNTPHTSPSDASSNGDEPAPSPEPSRRPSDMLPEVPLPEDAGKATNDAKDAINDIVPLP